MSAVSSDDSTPRLSLFSKFQLCISLLRPVTIVQAVGALVVGCLAIDARLPIPASILIPAVMSVYTSYGSGMAMNDCVDAPADQQHPQKQHRPIPSGQVTLREAWMFTTTVVVCSLVLAGCTSNVWFGLWTLHNLILMWMYAVGGWQKVFLLKNLLVGWLGMSPLVGATTLFMSSGQITAAAAPLLRLAAVGMGIGVAREILKDLEDTRVDRWAGKRTLPHVVGTHNSHRIAFGIVWACCAACWSPAYRSMSVSSPPVY